VQNAMKAGIIRRYYNFVLENNHICTYYFAEILQTEVYSEFGYLVLLPELGQSFHEEDYRVGILFVCGNQKLIFEKEDQNVF
jgi:hypothetical protein